MKSLLLLLLFTVLFFQNVKAQKLAALPYASGISNPIFLTHCGDERLFVLTRDGTIRIINADGTVRPTPFLDISSKISSYTDGEEGMLGLAFSPDYATDGKFYVDYTSNEGGQLHSVVEQYQVTADPNIADPSSGLIILIQDQPYNNHNGGNLMFGPDGFLYINFGDGGSGGDPQGNGQDVTTFLGKILRIDVSNASSGTPYTIPASNPFYGSAIPGIKKEIWAYGLRNPWRASFDRLTQDLWIGDVGQGEVEEIDFAESGDGGGHNYGWNIMEGDQCYNASTCNQTGLTLPLYTYTHSYGHSITGGYVWRSAQSKYLFGMYIFSDYVRKWIDGVSEEDGALSGSVNHLILAANVQGNPVSFGQDLYGDLYILFNGNNTVYKLQDTSYLRQPKAFFTAEDQGGGSFLFQGLEGKGLTYQWMLDGAPITGATVPEYTTSTEGTYTLEVTNSLGNSDISDPFTLGTVPVVLISFNAAKSGSASVLSWRTAAESNLKGFSVERKAGNQSEFAEIGFVAATSANGSSPNNGYTYNDSDPALGAINYYRLKAVNLDGGFQYSEIRRIKWTMETAFSVFPNPANGFVYVKIENRDHPVFVKIMNAQGQRVISQKIKENLTKIELKNIKGIFFLQIVDENGKVLSASKLVVH